MPKLGFLPGYADDFLPISPSARWIQTVIDKFIAFCDRKGLLVNPEKCKAMCSETIGFSKSLISRPVFHLNDRSIDYTDQARYLGFTLTSTLSSAAHMRASLTSFRKAIFTFKSTVKTRKKALIMQYAKTYIVPKIHNLEFVERITDAHVSRFDYLLCKLFSVHSVSKLNKIRQNQKCLNLKYLHEKARQRYQEDF